MPQAEPCSMNKNNPIRIRRVANGFIVEPSIDPRMMHDHADLFVFEDRERMFDWMMNHYPDEPEATPQ